MPRPLLAAAAVALLVAAAVASRQFPAAASRDPVVAPADLKIEADAKNPWTHLKVNAAPDQFQFAVVSDRTGGHRAQVFSRAVRQVNLLQPSFVMSVGDLIEGYTTKEEKIDAEWDEFDGFTRQFQMPFFYVVGNHDLTNQVQADKWDARYGRRHYSFVYRNALFLALNSEDPPGKTAISADQLADVKKVLAENANVRWTFVFLHKPIWTAKDLTANGWAPVEEALAGRKYTVFCGHEHRYQKFERNGAAYYQLATTGGGSKMRGLPFGEFDHVAWVTVKPSGEPVIANVLLEGVLPENLDLSAPDEPGVARKTQPTFPVRVRVTQAGQPVPGATVGFAKQLAATATQPARWSTIADGLTTADGSAQLSTYTAFDGVPAGEYTVTVVKFHGYREPADLAGENKLPAAFATPATSTLRATVTAAGPNEVALDLPAN